MNRSEIYKLIEQERLSQQVCKDKGKFKFICSDKEMNELEKIAVLTEETGEVATAVLVREGLATDKNTNLKKELVQVAAVAVAWLESLEE